MISLVLAILTAVFISFICSLSEASLFAISPAYVRLLSEKKGRVGKVLVKLKENMDKPISAILIINTIANVSMASIAGVKAYELWGEKGSLYVTVVFTFMILFFGEIVPKVFGVTYNRGATKIYVLPLKFAMNILLPFVWLIVQFSSLLRGKTKIAQAPEEEILAMAKISEEEGSILPIEKKIIIHALQLDNVTAESIMTPRTVMVVENGDKTLKEIQDKAITWRYSRIPIYEKEVDNITGIVLRRNVITSITKEGFVDKTLKEISNSLHFVPEMMTGDKLLAEFLTRKSHLFGVVDEYGEVLGIVTLEDVLEALIGTEIVDETDAVVDLQKLAKAKWQQKMDARL